MRKIPPLPRVSRLVVLFIHRIIPTPLAQASACASMKQPSTTKHLISVIRAIRGEKNKGPQGLKKIFTTNDTDDTNEKLYRNNIFCLVQASRLDCRHWRKHLLVPTIIQSSTTKHPISEIRVIRDEKKQRPAGPQKELHHE